MVDLELRGRLVVVVGGGPVGQRKLRKLRDAGAVVRVVALEPPSDEFADVDWRCESYRPEHLDGAALVVAAGPADVNRQVVDDATARGVWVNCADPGGIGSVRFAAEVEGPGYVVGVGTRGENPRLAVAVRDRIAAWLKQASGVASAPRVRHEP